MLDGNLVKTSVRHGITVILTVSLIPVCSPHNPKHNMPTLSLVFQITLATASLATINMSCLLYGAEFSCPGNEARRGAKVGNADFWLGMSRGSLEGRSKEKEKVT